MNTRLTHVLLLACMPMFSGCFAFPATENPLPGIEIMHGERRSEAVVVMLPGRGDRGDTFIAEGFDEAGRQLGFDTIAVDAHFGYYMKRNLLPRLHEDIILPARDAGYEKIWLLGISMGGFGSVLYAANHPDMIDGVVLLAPFLGERETIEEIVADGGLGRWDSASSELEDYEVAMWSWLDDVTSPPGTKPLILGYGRSDRLADAYGVLLDVLSPDSVYTIEGGHNWGTWRLLWAQIAPNLSFLTTDE